MARVTISDKYCAVNPLKMSPSIGAALAFLGVDNSMPLLHGSQGCTSFGLVLFVRHFREAIPMQTTAMSEVAAVLGGLDNLEQALVNIAGRTKPALIGISTTGISEIKGDDLRGFLKLIRANHPELAGIALVDVSTPDFHGAFQDGWAAAVTRMVEELVETPQFETGLSRRINVLRVVTLHLAISMNFGTSSRHSVSILFFCPISPAHLMDIFQQSSHQHRLAESQSNRFGEWVLLAGRSRSVNRCAEPQSPSNIIPEFLTSFSVDSRAGGQRWPDGIFVGY